jgi:hypothetical protein
MPVVAAGKRGDGRSEQERAADDERDARLLGDSSDGEGEQDDADDRGEDRPLSATTLMPT